MDLRHKYSKLDDHGEMAIYEIAKMWSGRTTKFADMTFYEFNQRRADGLFRKYVFAFNDRGENITSLVRIFLDLTKYAKQKKFYGAMMSGGYGFSYADSLIESLRYHGYRNYDLMVFCLMVDRKVSVV